MNDEFVSHNNSSGGWDRLNKWVSMLKKRGCVADPLKGAGGLFCVLNWKQHCVFNLWNFIKVWTKIVVTLSWEDMNLLILFYLPEFLMFCNKGRLHIWKWIWSFVSECAGMQKMWKDEVRRVERRVCFQECRGQSGECAPCGPPPSLSSSSVTVRPLRPAGEAQIFSFMPLRGAAVASPSPQRSRFSVLEALIGLSRTLPS